MRPERVGAGVGAATSSGLERVRKLDRRAAPLDLGLDEREGAELLVEACEVAGRGDALAVHLADHVARLQAELLREASRGRIFHPHAAAGRNADLPEVVELVRIAQGVIELAARERE